MGCVLLCVMQRGFGGEFTGYSPWFRANPPTGPMLCGLSPSSLAWTTPGPRGVVSNNFRAIDFLTVCGFRLQALSNRFVQTHSAYPQRFVLPLLSVQMGMGACGPCLCIPQVTPSDSPLNAPTNSCAQISSSPVPAIQCARLSICVQSGFSDSACCVVRNCRRYYVGIVPLPEDDY